MTNTLYENLEVSPNASPATIRAAYRSLSQRYHPDKNPGDSEAARRMQQINAAFQILSARETRAAYDAELSRLQRAAGPDGPPATGKTTRAYTSAACRPIKAPSSLASFPSVSHVVSPGRFRAPPVSKWQC
jgi:DnaJ-class molecular chaperone